MGVQAISISIVTYNSELYIGKLLDSFNQHVHHPDYHIYIIDNGSTDKTIDIIKDRISPSITLVQNPRNKGFGSGHNTILDQINSKYHVCVNPDIILVNDIISAMAHYMDENAEIGLVTPKILNLDGSLQILPKKNPKLIYLIARRINLSFLRKYREKYEMQEQKDNCKCDVEFCSGCFMFMRTALFKELGGFDERFYMYFEDADLTRRMRGQARAEYNSDFSVVHAWERAGSKKLKFFIIQIVSMLKYLIKWRGSNSKQVIKKRLTGLRGKK